MRIVHFMNLRWNLQDLEIEVHYHVSKRRVEQGVSYELLMSPNSKSGRLHLEKSRRSKA